MVLEKVTIPIRMTAEWETKEEVRWWCLRPLIAAPAILSLCSLATDPFFEWTQCCPAERCQSSEVKEVLNGTSEKPFKEERVTYSPLTPPLALPLQLDQSLQTIR